MECYNYNGLTNLRGNVDILPPLKSVVSLPAITDWGLCFWLKVGWVPPTDSTVIRISPNDQYAFNEGDHYPTIYTIYFVCYMFQLSLSVRTELMDPIT